MEHPTQFEEVTDKPAHTTLTTGKTPHSCLSLTSLKMADFDQEDYQNALNAPDQENQAVDKAPRLRQRLGPFTIVCLVLNRTIGKLSNSPVALADQRPGSGIFVTPVKVLNGTGSIGVALIFWTLGGFLTMCGLLVWLELGLSIPFRNVEVLPGVFEKRSVARSGGEKNYVRSQLSLNS